MEKNCDISISSCEVPGFEGAWEALLKFLHCPSGKQVSALSWRSLSYLSYLIRYVGVSFFERGASSMLTEGYISY